MWWVMNAIAHASAAPTTGPKLDNRRVLAAIVDLAIVVAGAAGDPVRGRRAVGRHRRRPGALGAVILGWALYYYFALESGDGQTLGKRLMKLRVVRADGRPGRDGRDRRADRAARGGRIGLYLVGLIVMLATGERRQRLGDLAAGTIVVDASAPATMPPAPVAAPIDEAPADDEPEQEDASASTITLPSRPGSPATLDDLSPTEAPRCPRCARSTRRRWRTRPSRSRTSPVAEPDRGRARLRAAEPIEDEPAFEAEPARRGRGRGRAGARRPGSGAGQDEPVEDEPVAEEPVAEEPVAEEAVAEEPLPNVSTPAIEELATRSRPRAPRRCRCTGPRTSRPRTSPASDEPITLKSVETVSAIDLVMGGEDARRGGRLLGAGSGPRAARRLARRHLAMPTLVGSRWQRSAHPSSRCASRSSAPGRRASTRPGTC